MIKRKPLAFLLAAAVAATFAAGCNSTTVNNNNNNNNDNDNQNNNTNTNTQTVQLAKPQISLSGNVISWTAVENATGYNVLEGTQVVSSAQTALSYTVNKTDVGSYTYTVVAVSSDEKYTASEASNSVTYTVAAQQQPPTPATDTSTKLTGKVYVVGDSTSCSYEGKDADRYIPRDGYGTQLYNYLNCDKEQVVDLAVSGDSSYSFLSESNYTTLKNNIGEGDYLIIGFGHNDQKDAIYTNPNLTSSDETLLGGQTGHYASFKYTLKHFYIDLAKEKNATPILCTPIVRANSSDNYSAKSGHVISASDGGAYPGGDYPKAIRELGTECGVTVVDLTALTKEEYTEIGYNEAIKYHSYNTAKHDTDGVTVIPDGVDNTHTNRYGAMMNAYRIASEILKSQNSLKTHVKTTIQKPEYAVEFPAGINQGYEVKDYTPFAPANKSSKYNITADGWYGSAFGNISVSKAVINQITDDTFKVGTTGDGKITSSGDGFATVFRQLDADRNFKIEATVTVNAYKSGDNQTGFGIMLRDDMYIDYKDTGLKSNYVAAGYYGVPTSANVNFYREAGSLKPVLTGQTIDVSVNSVHTISLERTGTTVKVTIDNKTYSTKADFALTSVDSNYMYLCLFATRETQVTFSNIVYTDKGTSVA